MKSSNYCFFIDFLSAISGNDTNKKLNEFVKKLVNSFKEKWKIILNKNVNQKEINHLSFKKKIGNIQNKKRIKIEI